MRTFDVYLPVAVRVLVDDEGEMIVEGFEVEWQGTPWPDADNIWDVERGDYVSHHGDETSVLYRAEVVAEAIIAKRGWAIYQGGPPTNAA